MYNDDQSEDIIDNGFMETPSLSRKRKREIKKEEVKKSGCIDSSPPEEVYENFPFPSKELTNSETTPEDYIMYLLLNK